MELYCHANDVEEEKKVSVPLSLMDPLLRKLVSLGKLSSKKFYEIITILQIRLNPKPLVIAERFIFHKRNQSKEESVCELRKLSQYCDFKKGLSDALRDRLVCGMHCSSTQKRLLSEKELDLDKALAITISIETAAKDASELQKRL